MKKKIVGSLFLIWFVFTSLTSCLSLFGIKTLDLKKVDKSQPVHIGKIAYSVSRGDTLRINPATGERNVAPDKLPLVFPMLNILVKQVDLVAAEYYKKTGITLDTERFKREYAEAKADNFTLRDLPSGTRTELAWEPEKQDNPTATITAGNWYPEIQVGLLQNIDGQTYAKMIALK